MQRAIFYKRSEDEDEADGYKQVHRSHVGNFWEGFPGNSTQRGHSQHRGDAWCEIGEKSEKMRSALKQGKLEMCKLKFCTFT